jgi:hypothetical protein
LCLPVLIARQNPHRIEGQATSFEREVEGFMSEDKLRKVAVGPLTEKEARLLAVLMPLILLVADIAAFALCFWWYHLGLLLSIVVAMLTPIVLLLGIVMLVRFWPTGSKTTGERKPG